MSELNTIRLTLMSCHSVLARCKILLNRQQNLFCNKVERWNRWKYTNGFTMRRGSEHPSLSRWSLIKAATAKHVLKSTSDAACENIKKSLLPCYHNIFYSPLSLSASCSSPPLTHQVPNIDRLMLYCLCILKNTTKLSLAAIHST